jgi:hypothetical protein
MEAKPTNQSPHAVLMVNPLGFNPNPETAVDNAFQDAEIVDAGLDERGVVALKHALLEFSAPGVATGEKCVTTRGAK